MSEENGTEDAAESWNDDVEQERQNMEIGNNTLPKEFPTHPMEQPLPGRSPKVHFLPEQRPHPPHTAINMLQPANTKLVTISPHLQVCQTQDIRIARNNLLTAVEYLPLFEELKTTARNTVTAMFDTAEEQYRPPPTVQERNEMRFDEINTRTSKTFFYTRLYWVNC